MSMLKTISKFSLAAVCIVAAQMAPAKQIQLSVEAANGVLPANTTDKTFIKVSLIGEPIQASQTRAPVNVALVLDQSGSMAGAKLENAKDAAIYALDFLTASDIVSVITYGSTARTVVPATRMSDKQYIKQQIRNIQSTGNTALFAGVSQGAHELRKFFDVNQVNRIILLSDGQANVGPSTPRELGELGASYGREGITVTTIGLGDGYNEDLMVQLAGYSDGNHAFVAEANELQNVFNKEFGTVLSVVAQQVDIHLNFAPHLKPIRVIGRDAEIVGQKVSLGMNQMYSNQDKYVIVEAQVLPTKVTKKAKIVDVAVDYDDLFTAKRERIETTSYVSFSESQKEVKAAVSKDVMTRAIKQVINEETDRAVQLRDAGKVEEAKAVLQKAAETSSFSAEAYNAPELEVLEEELRQDADSLDDAGDWNTKRKSLRERQYKTKNNQVY